jgi:SRSO17 transposase
MKKQNKYRRRKAPASSHKSSSKLAARDVQFSVQSLVIFQRRLTDVFQRREQRDWFLFYLCGQLSNLERKTIEPMVLGLHGPAPQVIRALQYHIRQSGWESQALIARLQTLAGEWLADPAGVLIVDGSGFPKQGSESVGVARQYCGHLGKVANCQEGVFLIYASPDGYAFVDERLYVHQSWFQKESYARWQRCGIPEETIFKTEPQLALEMIRKIVERDQLPFRWVTADERFGRNQAFLKVISALGKWYLVEVPADTRFWNHRPGIEPPGPGVLGRPRLHPRVVTSAPAPREIRELAKHLPASAWKTYVIKEGSRGPLRAEFAFLRLVTVDEKLPGERMWVILRRALSTPSAIKYYQSNAPRTCTPADFVWASGQRWPIETAFEEGKGEVGMDHYETRTWLGWHHHQAQTFAAQLFLVYLHIQFKKKSRAHDRPGAATNCPGNRRRLSTFTGYLAQSSLPSKEKLCRLLFSSQTHPQTPSAINRRT